MASLAHAPTNRTLEHPPGSSRFPTWPGRNGRGAARGVYGRARAGGTIPHRGHRGGLCDQAGPALLRVSQAGRAIAAVRADEPWEIRGHGASVSTSDKTCATTVKADRTARGAIGVVARATGSDLWEGAATLASLWASLPELPHWEALIGSAQTPLPVLCMDAPAYGTAYTVQGLMAGSGPSVGLPVDETPPDPEKRRALVERILAPYPKAAGWSFSSDNTLSISLDPQPRHWIYVVWRGTDATGKAVTIDPKLLTEEHDGLAYFRPGLGNGKAVPSPLITWWGLLLALSSLARYEPVVWRQALDIDRSPIAWPLEQGLRVAEQRIPELVLHAITSE